MSSKILYINQVFSLIVYGRNYRDLIPKLNMQTEFKLKQNKFLRNYYPVLVHQMNCILESRMMLDEDLHMLLTFWCPTTLPKNTNYYSTVACAVSAITGAVISTKLNKIYPLIASFTPTVMQFSYKVGIVYSTRKYKRNGETLISLLKELRELNRNVLEYNHKTMINVSKMSETGCGLLKTTRCEFLQFTIITVMSILHKLVATMRSISKIVPISEGDYMYAADWDLRHLVPQGSVEFNEMLHRFDTLSDLAVLIISNFLACVGLSFCVQLWKDNSPNIRKIFDDIIPELCAFIGLSIQNIKEKFSFICFTLVDSVDEFKKQLRQKSNTHVQVLRPLDDFFTSYADTFEVSKNLRLLLDEDEPKNIMDVPLAVDDVVQQFSKCNDLLASVLRLQRIVSKHPSISNNIEQRPNDIVQASSFLAPVEVHQEDDSAHGLDDEEYSLSIHGSDAEEDIIMPIMDFAEHCSAENLELMLAELKRKLDERKIQKESDSQQAEEAVEVDNSEVSIPPPPPPPAIPCLPPIDTSRRNFLHAVRLMAQNLNREEEFQFGFNMFPEIPRPFNTTYHCYSVAMLPGNERQDVERGGKIIMPPSALEQLTRLNINYPMLFKIFNKKTNRISHCGVLEFVADEGKVYLPLWLMHNLILDEGDLIQIESVSLPIGTFAKFQPLSSEFLDISNPKAVLENCLRTFACLTNGDVIAVKYNQKVYELCVLETQPGNAISIIECDMNVEFAAPIGYKETEESKSDEEEMTVDPADLMPEPSGFVAFKGTGNRLDGKRRKDSASLDMPVQKPVYVRGIPDYDYQIGTLRFLRNVIKSSVVDKDENPEFKVFGGKGFSLKRGGI